jgi:hypothetical protein
MSLTATAILDPVEVASPGRTEVKLTDSGLEIYWQGLDFGDQQVKQFMSEGLFGSTPIDHVWPTVTVKIPLVVRATETRSFDDWRVLLQQKVAEFNQEGGGRLKRVLTSGRYGYADITEAKLHFSSSWLAERKSVDRECTLELQRLPDWYGDEITGTAHEFTGDGSFTEVIGGDMPARVVNMQVEDKSGNNQNGLLFHYRGRNYSSANTAEWAYNAEALGLLDIAEKVTLTGSYGTKVVKHPKLSTGWTPVLATNKAGTTFLTHTGLYNVWARVYSTSEKLPWLRLVYGVGDVVAPAENNQIQVPGKEGFYYVPLGQVNIAALPFGAQRWEGVIQARGEAGGENIYIDRLLFECADECSGVLAARRSATALASLTAYDSLIGTGALGGSEATRGGKWEESGSTKGPFVRTAEGAIREAKEETEGRMATLAGSTVGAANVRAEIYWAGAAGSTSLYQGLYARYFSPSYFVRVVRRLGPAGPELCVEYADGGGLQTFTLATGVLSLREAFLMIECELNAAAELVVSCIGNTYRFQLPTTFKKGEAHAEGRVGTFDWNPSNSPYVRKTRNFFASPVPPSDSVMYANKSAYLSTVGNYRQSEDGAGASPIGYPGSDLPRLPVSGPDGSPIEIAVKPSRGQFGEIADSGKDKFKVQVTRRECFAEIPSS